MSAPVYWAAGYFASVLVVYAILHWLDVALDGDRPVIEAAFWPLFTVFALVVLPFLAIEWAVRRAKKWRSRERRREAAEVLEND